MKKGRRRGTDIAIAIVAIIAIILIINPETEYFQDLFTNEHPPDVRFYEGYPKVESNTVEKGKTMIVEIIGRNYEDEPVENIQVYTSVIEGDNWETHLEFEPIVSLGYINTSLGLSTKEFVQITAIDLTSKKSEFDLQMELVVNGEKTGNTYEFPLTIIPPSN